MTKGFIISGTDTGIGKTTVSAMLLRALDAAYWKPIQSGTVDATDRQTVQQLTRLPDVRFFHESFILTQPLSPHRAAELDGIKIDVEKLAPQITSRTLLIEGAGGLLVPITRKFLQIDLFRRFDLPIILCARTALGTINHTLLSVEALRARHIPIHGIIFVGDDNPDNIKTIIDFTETKNLGRLPQLEILNAATLDQAFANHFNRADFD